MANVSIVGGTGLVGSNIVNTLLSLPSINKIEFLARRPPSDPTTENLKQSHSDKLSPFISSEPPATWASHIRSLSPIPDIFFSSLGTTRASAGGFGPQYALEHDTNLELARAAKEAGTKVYVLISATGADPKSRIPYSRMKGEIEQSIIGLGFDKMVIVRPMIIVGNRTESRPAEAVLRNVANVMGGVSKPWLKDWWAQDAIEIARASVNAGLQSLKGTGEGEQKVRYLSGKDIVRLGRTEWKAE